MTPLEKKALDLQKSVSMADSKDLINVSINVSMDNNTRSTIENLSVAE
jgi:hypothetical protein